MQRVMSTSHGFKFTLTHGCPTMLLGAHLIFKSGFMGLDLNSQIWI